MARIALEKSPVKHPQSAAPPEHSASKHDADWSIDNESRELDLLGKMHSICGLAGHIFRPTANADWGIDGEIEFKDDAQRATGARLYVQLKSGDSHLVPRKSDGEEIFTVKNRRHLDYWAQQAYPVMLVIQRSKGLIRWMDVSEYLKANGRTNAQLIFRGTPLTPESLRSLGDTILKDLKQQDENRDDAAASLLARFDKLPHSRLPSWPTRF